MSKIVGIDLGTTNSLVGVMDAGFPVLIADADGRRLTPSIVHFPGAGTNRDSSSETPNSTSSRMSGPRLNKSSISSWFWFSDINRGCAAFSRFSGLAHLRVRPKPRAAAQFP